MTNPFFSGLHGTSRTEFGKMRCMNVVNSNILVVAIFVVAILFVVAIVIVTIVVATIISVV